MNNRTIEKSEKKMIERIICCWWIICLVFKASSVDALKLLKVTVPGYKVRGEMAILVCDYELDGEVLYAVKWYKDDEEFYRFVPKSNPPQHSYKVDGIKVDHQLSDSKQVALRSVNLKSSGLYRCEVSAEAPSFASAQNEGRMDVVFLPREGPHITGEDKEYQVGDEIVFNCTSGKSYPESTLHWFINDKPITNPKDLRRYPNMVHSHGLLTTTLGLRLQAKASYFINGQMRVKCVASVSPVLWRGDRESVLQSAVPLIENREALIFVKGSSVRATQGFSASLLVAAVLLVHLASS